MPSAPAIETQEPSAKSSEQTTKSSEQTTKSSGPLITMLFDGACPLCKREAGMIRRADRHGRVGMRDIAAPDFDPAEFGLSHDAVHARIHGVLADGTVLEGMEVFRRVYAAIGRGWMLGWTRWPIARPITDAMYRWFARNRHRLTFRKNPCSDACTPRV